MTSTIPTVSMDTLGAANRIELQEHGCEAIGLRQAVAMREGHIAFNDNMVRSTLDGTMTQTRRVVRRVLNNNRLQMKREQIHVLDPRLPCPYGRSGDRLWVQEAWARYNIDHVSHDMAYRATVPSDWPKGGRWRQSNHMPRWASRILLEITSIRVEHLQDITVADAEAQGIDFLRHLPDADETLTPIQLFQCLWDSNNTGRADDCWKANPWVWVIGFRLIQKEAM